MNEVQRIAATRVGARNERTRHYTLGLLPATERGSAVLVVQNNYNGHADSYALPEGEYLARDGVPGWSRADLDTLIATAGELASTYGIDALDRDDVLSTRQRQVLAKAGQEFGEDTGDES